MARHLRYHPQVADDLSAAIDWYEARSTGLGWRFRAIVDARFDDIARMPEVFPQAFDDADFRFARVPKFPYLVLFRIREQTVFLLGVFHSATNPAKWRERADSE
ncbi:MAG: type II toxin-antitoxin system RelE/ParE family toxin [Thermoguttaceae bacterium]|jgi:hypothetical protein|nr:type II toxin-antitoxin system RelE/ParE family toxin [Thermoguttaceae bacterium]